MPSKFSEANHQDTLCYMCSLCCFKCCSAIFASCLRHKQRTLIISGSILSFIGCLTIQIYVWYNIEHSSSLDDGGCESRTAYGDKTNCDEWTPPYAIALLYFLYALCSSISKCISSWITGFTNEDSLKAEFGEDNICYGTCVYKIWCFPCVKWKNIMLKFGPKYDMEESKFDCVWIIFYNIFQHSIVNFGIFTMTILILYLCNVILDDWWMALCLIGMINLIIIGLYYTIAGILWVIYVTVGKCIVEPIYGLRAFLRNIGRENDDEDPNADSNETEQDDKTPV